MTQYTEEQLLAFAERYAYHVLNNMINHPNGHKIGYNLVWIRSYFDNLNVSK